MLSCQRESNSIVLRLYTSDHRVTPSKMDSSMSESVRAGGGGMSEMKMVAEPS
jgi:hypothetical protein